MKDIQLIFCVISLFAGISSISISFFIYNMNKKKPLKFFIGLNLCFFAIQSAITLNIYSEIVIQVSSFVSILSKFLDIIGTSFSSLFGLFFINYIFGLKITNLKRNLYIIVFLYQMIAGILYYLIETNSIFQFFLKASLIIVISYEIYVGLRNYNLIVNKILKRAIKLFILITVVFLPLLILQLSNFHIKLGNSIELVKLSALPSYFLIINVFALLFVLKYFNTPAFISNNKLTDYFKQKYDITGKQGEIIELIIEGNTYKQIAEKLFISSKTVDNHMQNIYKKLNVNSKIQLLNFVRSNE